MLEFVNCQQLHLSGLTIANSPTWTFRAVACDTVAIDHVTINNPRYGPNTDGIDVTCSSNLTINGCTITTGDDAICLKSEGAYGLLQPTRNVTVRNCTIDTNCNGFKIGTGSQASFEDIHISDCHFVSRYKNVGERMISAISLEMVDGGSLRGFSGTNLTSEGARAPLFLRLGNRGWNQKTPIPGVMEDIVISEFTASGAVTTSSITGLPNHPIREVTLKNISISNDETGTASWVDHPVPEMENAYPEARMFGKLPASALYCRHAERINISNFNLISTRPDARSALVCDDVSDLILDRFVVARSEGKRPVLALSNVANIAIRNCTVPKGTDTYLDVKNIKSRRISLQVEYARRARRLVTSEEPSAIIVSTRNNKGVANAESTDH